ncbi:MAG: hypothetical protein AMJ46_06270 [Latescibacteria bacterium DG_63]|nr:MAG: hypothetical protein AMJ46_06270 [Latescibacteria bacterium DG_63]
MRGSVMTGVLFIGGLVLLTATFSPCAGQDHYVYARANTSGLPIENGPRLGWAMAQSYTPGPPANRLALSEVYVEEAGGMTWGPVPLGGGSYYGIGAMVFGWSPPPVNGFASAEGWFESDGPFTINIAEEGIHVAVNASGNSNIAGTLGIIVTEYEVPVYDVAVEWGWNSEVGSYFNVIENVGVWPGTWQIVSSPFTLVREHPPFQLQFNPAGLARARFYATGSISPVVGAMPAAANWTQSSQDEVKSYFVQELVAPTYGRAPALSEHAIGVAVLVLALVGVVAIIRRRLLVMAR